MSLCYVAALTVSGSSCRGSAPVRSMSGPSVALLLAATVLHSAAIDVVVSSDGHVEQVTQGLAEENWVMTLWDING